MLVGTKVGLQRRYKHSVFVAHSRRGLLQARMQRGMLLDQGQAFESDFHEGTDASELKVSQCIYNDILREEGRPSLLAVCCCSQDASWCASMGVTAWHRHT
jgi:hypothetical protein